MRKEPRSNGSKPEPAAAPPKRRGRPPGSKTLKLETAETIAGLLVRGALPQEAAPLAGINLRTYYEWMQLGEGRHPTRKPSPKHKRFAEIVNEGIAAGMGGAQIRLYSASAEKWIPMATKLLNGARGPAGAEGAILASLPEEDLVAEAERMVVALLDSGALRLRHCPNANCNCGYHGPRGRSERTKTKPGRAGAASTRTRQTRRRTKRSHDAN